MAVRGTLLTAWVAALVCGLVGCGGSQNQPAPAGLNVDVTIAKGQVTPTNATLRAKVRQQITRRAAHHDAGHGRLYVHRLYLLFGG
jgi:hypothetical protein